VVLPRVHVINHNRNHQNVTRFNILGLIDAPGGTHCHTDHHSAWTLSGWWFSRAPLSVRAPGPRAGRRACWVLVAPVPALVMTSGAWALGEDVLLLVFAVGGLGQRELGRCGAVCRDWRAVHRAPSLWARLLRSLCCSFGTDPFVGVDAVHSAPTGADEDDAWFQAHGLLYRSLQQQCRAWTERVGSGEALAGGNMSALTASERRRPRNLWDVLCCRSPLEHFQQQQRRGSTFVELGEAWKQDRSLHCGLWESLPVAEAAAGERCWRRVVPATGAMAVDVVAHVCMTWLLCQQHDLLARKPELGYLWTPWAVETVDPKPGIGPRGSVAADFLLGIRPGSFTGTSVQDERATLDKEVWTTDLSAAIDCLLGLNPNDKTHASVSCALARFNGHFFRLRSKVISTVDARDARSDRQELPLMCTWAPLCSVLAHGGHAVSNLHELTVAPQSVDTWRNSPNGRAVLARAKLWRNASKVAHRPTRTRAAAGTIFLQSVRAQRSQTFSSHATDVHPDQIELLRVSKPFQVAQLVVSATTRLNALALIDLACPFLATLLGLSDQCPHG
jgi:hypothetical protein